MIKKKRLEGELRKTSGRIYFLVFLSFLFLFLFFYSYGGENYNKSYGEFNNGLSSQKGVDVFVNVMGNSAPIILFNDSQIYVCEGNSLYYPFKVIDIDGDDISGSIDPVYPFFVIFLSRLDTVNLGFAIVSATLNKNDAGGVNSGFKTYQENISMSDSRYVASKNINITVIEINNFPVIQNIGVQTVWTHGDNSTFDYQVIADDIEDGDSNSGNFGFNVSFSGDKLFDILKNGTMYFEPNSSQVGVYEIQVCVNDKGLKNPSPDISLCNQDGSSLYSCNNFSLTVTDDNRAPEITSHFPENLTINYSDGENVFFNISSHDPDGTLVDNYWYVDDNLTKYDPQNNVSNFSFTYTCGFNGNSTIKVVITDGLLNNSIEWNLSVSRAPCPTSNSGGGGGGGGKTTCTEKWVCYDWSECKNLKENLDYGKVSYKASILIKNNCSVFKWNDSSCGFQNRKCVDLKKCNTNLSMPGTMQECQYVKNPSCNDSIKNCHNGSCERGIDCGGPCSPCTSCSDGIKNQGETGIDCGGPCLPCKETPKGTIDYFKIIMFFSIIFLILAMIAIAILGIKYVKLRQILEDMIHRHPSTNVVNDINKL